jgi:hypothetical protein
VFSETQNKLLKNDGDMKPSPTPIVTAIAGRNEAVKTNNDVAGNVCKEWQKTAKILN